MKAFLILLAIMLLSAGAVYTVVEVRKESRRQEEVERIETKQRNDLKLDSLRLHLETHFRDSLKVQAEAFGIEIKGLKSDIKKLRNANTIRQKRYDSVRVTLPVF